MRRKVVFGGAPTARQTLLAGQAWQAVSALNQTTVSYPGSIRTRFGDRNPQTHTYASFAPVLHNLGLSAQQENQIVAFLSTLTDGYTPPRK